MYICLVEPQLLLEGQVQTHWVQGGKNMRAKPPERATYDALPGLSATPEVGYQE